MLKEWPSKSQWRQFLKVLNRKEKFNFFTFLALFVASAFYLSFSFYLSNTQEIPSQGGSYTEGLLGSPRFINPIYAAAFDTDRDLSELIYSGLMKYNGEGEIVPSLAKNYNILEEGRVFEFELKDELYWSDGKPLTAEDVLFTIKSIQNPSLKSPLRANWLGVEAEKTAENKIQFKLKNSSAVFLANATLGILPKHIWEEVSYQNFPLSIYNLKPVGSGPYKIKELAQNNQGNIVSIELVSNPYYSGEKPNITNLEFVFFDKEEDLVKAFNAGKIDGVSFSSQNNELKRGDYKTYELSLPSYFAVFFNLKETEILEDEKVRMALNYGTNKEEIINEALLGEAKIVDSPILPDIYGFEKEGIAYQFDAEKARELLQNAGFVDLENGFREKIIKKTPSFQFKSDLRLGSRSDEVKELQKCLAKDETIYPEAETTGYFGEKTEEAVIRFQEKYSKEILEPSGLTEGNGKVLSATRKKLNELCASPSEKSLPLSLSLSTVEQPLLTKVASILKKQWKEIGVNLEINTYDISTLELEVIKPRKYEMLLFGEVLGAIADPFPFWHSSQIKDPGLNLTNYDDKKSDKLLEENRQSLDKEKRKEALEEFQNILLSSAPAVFLYTPSYPFMISSKIKGIDTTMITDSSKRFCNIENWYIKTKKIWK